MAIACAALLATTVIASGSANAQPTLSDAETTQLPDVVLNEIGVDMFSFSTGTTGTFIELKNTSSNSVSLANYTLDGCNANSGPIPLVTFDFADVVPASGFFIIADNAYGSLGGPPRDKALPDGFLEQADGGMELTDFGASNIQNVKWGSPAFDCLSFDDAGVAPDDDNSLQLNTTPPPTWCALPPTVGDENASC